MGLIRMYQKALRRSETIGVGSSGLGFFILFHVLGVGLVALFFITFPYQETRTENIQLLPGNHKWVKESPIHKFSPVAVTYERDFLNLAGEEKILVSTDGPDADVTYEVITVGKPFQYHKYRDPSLFLLGYRGGVESAEIYDGVLTLTLHRDWFTVKFMGIFFVVIALVFAGSVRWIFISSPPRLRETRIRPC